MLVKNRFVLSGFVVVFGMLNVATAAAQDYGARFGLSVNPDQFYFGGHVESEPIYEELRFRPNVEIGFGDGVTLVGLNGEFVWPFELRTSGSIYAGLGPAINIFSFDAGPTRDTDVEPGLNFVIGYEFDEGFFTEFKVGAIDSPEVKFGVGYTWRQ